MFPTFEATSMRRAVLLVMSSALAGCAESGLAPVVSEREVGRAIQTEALSYQLTTSDDTMDGRIIFSIVNRDSRAIAIENCRGGYLLWLQKLEGTAWVDAWSPILLLCRSEPIVIAPGATFRDTLVVSAGRPGRNTEPTFRTRSVPGVYRLVLGASTYVGSPAASVPEAERISNRFSLGVR